MNSNPILHRLGDSLILSALVLQGCGPAIPVAPPSASEPMRSDHQEVSPWEVPGRHLEPRWVLSQEPLNLQAPWVEANEPMHEADREIVFLNTIDFYAGNYHLVWSSDAFGSPITSTQVLHYIHTGVNRQRVNSRPAAWQSDDRQIWFIPISNLLRTAEPASAPELRAAETQVITLNFSLENGSHPSVEIRFRSRR